MLSETERLAPSNNKQEAITVFECLLGGQHIAMRAETLGRNKKDAYLCGCASAHSVAASVRVSLPHRRHAVWPVSHRRHTAAQEWSTGHLRQIDLTQHCALLSGLSVCSVTTVQTMKERFSEAATMFTKRVQLYCDRACECLSNACIDYNILPTPAAE